MGPYNDAEEHERHVLSTAGAGNWPDTADDEYRFDRKKDALVSALVHIPDAPTPEPPPWHTTPTTQATLTTTAPDPRQPASHYWLPPTATALACAYELAPEQPPTRLRLAPAFSLLIAGDRLCGWLLEHPDRHVTTGWSHPSPSIPDNPFRTALTRYFHLTTPNAVAAMEDGDPTVLAQLAALRTAVPLTEGVRLRRAALHAAVEELLDFYG
ncbi:hypothetical protein GCM10010428_47540 [Actinosynnema pretiosum subsp. pretiosum]